MQRILYEVGNGRVAAEVDVYEGTDVNADV